MKDKHLVTQNRLFELVSDCKSGQIRRADAQMTVAGSLYDVSIYRMGEYLVRVDFKTPKKGE
jgi:hypothetical protein